MPSVTDVAILASLQEDFFSSVSLTSSCPDGHCQVPAGHTWILDQSVDVQTLGAVKICVLSQHVHVDLDVRLSESKCRLFRPVETQRESVIAGGRT